MITWIIILSWLAFVIVAINVIIKVAFMLGMKKTNRWCPLNKWYLTEDKNFAISYSWYETISKAQEASKARTRE